MKDRKQRLADISIALFLLNDAAALAPTAAVPAPRRTRTGPLVTAVALGVVAGAALAVLTLPAMNRAVAPTPTRTSLLLPADRPVAVSNLTPNSLLAISPDGATVAYVSLNVNAPAAQRRQITVRSLSAVTTRDLPGAVGAYNPFFSPDGAWVGFFTAGGELKKVAIGGGSPVTIASKIISSQFAAAVWVDADTIVFGGIGTGLTEIAADGSAQKEIAALDTARGEDRHLPRSVIHESRALLFRTASRLEAFDLNSGGRHVIVEPGGFGDAVGDHLLFRRDDALLVAPFDRNRLALAGAAAPFVDDVLKDGPASIGSTPQVAVASNGTLAYVPAGNASRRVLGTVGRDGTFTPIGIEPAYLSRPRVSPDGRHLLFVRRTAGGGEQTVPVYDLARGTTAMLLRNERGRIGGPVWRPPDGAEVALYLQRPGGDGLYLVDLSGKEQLILKTGPSINWLRPESFSDGSVLAYTQQQGGQFDVWTVSVADPSTARPFINSAASEDSPKFSPDGHWLAYVSSESGRSQVYVRGYPRGESIPVSSSGATGPVWSRDGRTLFFESRAASGPVLMSVSATPAAGTLNLGPTTIVLNQRAPAPSGAVEEYIQGAVWGAEFDVLPDGRFVMVRGADPQGVREIVVVQNWFEELKRLAPGRR